MVTFLVLNAAVVFVAIVLAVARGAGGRVSRVLLGTLCGYLILVHSILLLAGLVGHLAVGGVALLVAGAMAGALGLARCGGCEPASEHLGGGPRGAPALFSPLAAVTAGVVWVWPHLFHATRLWIWDDYTYHMIYPALWLRQHAIVAASPPQAFTMQAWYPLSASLVATWFMMPFAGSRGEALAWVSLAGPLYAGIVAMGTVELLARLGCRGGAWAVPVVLFLTSQRVSVMASSFSDADLAQAATLFAAFVFAVPVGETETGRDVRADAFYAGLLSGIAIGVKVSAAAPALIVLLMMAVRAGAAPTRGRRWAQASGVGLVFAASWVATGGYWYLRNAIHTGNPVYPAAFLGWSGSTFPETTLREYSRYYGLRRAVADALVVYLNWPRFHATVALIGLVGLAAWALARRRLLTRPRRCFATGVLAVAATVLILLPSTPYSAGNAMTFRAGLVHWDSMRYVALLPLFGWAALGFLIATGAGGWRTVAAIGITTGSLLASGSAILRSPLLLAALGLGVVVLASLQRGDGWRPPKRLRAEALTVGAATLGLAVIVAGWHGAKAAATEASFYQEPLFGGAVAVLDRQPAGTRVAIFGDQWVYPALGARDHLVPVRLDGDGRVASDPIGDAMAPGSLGVDPPTFRSNLQASGVGVVAVVHLPHPGRSPEWPAQQAALDAIPQARVLHRDQAVIIWALGP
jgi:hypothetical protein